MSGPEFTSVKVFATALLKSRVSLLLVILMSLQLTACGFLITPIQLGAAELASSAVIATDATIKTGVSTSSQLAEGSVMAYQKSAAMGERFWKYLDEQARRPDAKTTRK